MSTSLRVLTTALHAEAFVDYAAALTARGQGAFIPGADDKAVAQAWWAATVLEAAGDGDPAALGGDARRCWVFPTVRDLAVRLHRGETPVHIWSHAFGTTRLEAKVSRDRKIVRTERFGGAHLNHAVGFARAAFPRQRATNGEERGASATGAGAYVIAFLEDWMLETPDFHTSLNFAALWKVPVLFVCLGVRAGELLAAAEGYGLVGHGVDPTAAAWFAGVRRVVADGGPTLLAGLPNPEGMEAALAEWLRDRAVDLAELRRRAVAAVSEAAEGAQAMPLPNEEALRSLARLV